jgi:hypothetical protein
MLLLLNQLSRFVTAKVLKMSYHKTAILAA